MKAQPKRKRIARHPIAQTPIQKGLYWVVCGSVLGISLIVSVDGRDPFRLPKDLLFRGEFIVVTALIAIGALLGQIPVRKPNWKNPALFLPVLILAWTLTSTLTSTNRALSWTSFVYTIGTAVIFLATVSVAHIHGLKMLNWILAAGVLNALAYLAQALEVWNPFRFVDPYWIARASNEQAAPLAYTGFLGNANDVGSYLVPVVIVSMTLAIFTKPKRLLHVSIATLLIVTLVIAGSLAALAATLLSVLAVATFTSRRVALAVSMGFVVFSSLAFAGYAGRETISRNSPGREQVEGKITRLIRAVDTNNSYDLLRGRLPSYKAAFAMFVDRPAVGVGPGVFGWQYYPYKIRISEHETDSHFAIAQKSTLVSSFREAHNDYLEVLAETGLPGFMLLIGSLVWVSSIGLRKRDPEQPASGESRAAQVIFLPLSVGFAALAVFLYPLQLSSSLSSLIFILAVCIAASGRKHAPDEMSRRDVSYARAANPVRWVVVLLVVGITALSLFEWCLNAWRCNRISKEQEAILHMAMSGNDGAQKLLEENLDRSLECMKCLPENEALPIVVASAYERLNRLESALATYDKALERGRRPEYYFNRAVIRLNLGDMPGALDDFESAVRFTPAMLEKIKNPALRESVALRVSLPDSQG